MRAEVEEHQATVVKREVADTMVCKQEAERGQKSDFLRFPVESCWFHK